MPFKKIRGIPTEEIFETKVRDGTGRVISKWVCLKEDFPKVIRILNEKFDLNIKELKIKKKKTDLDWLKN